MKLRAACVAVGFLSLALSLVPLTLAQTPAETASALPHLVRFGGTLKDLDGNPLTGVVGITFVLYSEPTGGAALWLETQNITADSNGHYVALLGSTKPDGLPTDVFTSERARWVGVQIAGQAEQPRVLLVSAPYALKAGDAETLGGLPPSAFMLANGSQGAASSAKGASAPAAAGAQKNSVPPANPAVTGKGAVDYIPMWDTTSDIVDSIIFQKSSEIGINTTTPAALLDVNGKTDIRDTLTLYPKSTDNTLAVNGTSFKIDQTGKVTFIAGQSFPGAGTITGVTTATGSGLSGGGTTGTLSLKVPSAGITNAMLANSKVTLDANAAGGITTPGAMTLGSTHTIGLKTCSANQVLQYVGTTWTCSNAGTGTVTSVSSGAGLTGGPITSSGTLSIDTTKVPLLNAGTNAFTGIISAPLFESSNGTFSVLESNGFATSVTINNGDGIDVSASSGAARGISVVNGGSSGPAIMTTSSTTGVEAIYSAGLSNTGAGDNNANFSSGVWADTSNTTTSSRQALLATADDAGSILAVNSSPGLDTILAIQNGASNALTGEALSGLAGVAGIGGTGVIGSGGNGSNTGVAGYGASTGSGVVGTAGSGGGGYGVFSYGNIGATGTITGNLPLQDGRVVTLYAMQSPENWFEDFGSGQLTDGAASIEIDPTFAKTINVEVGYRVFLTANGECEGLYIALKTATTFEVRELRGGSSAVTFDYRIVAKRKGLENLRLENVGGDRETAEAMRQQVAARPSHVPPRGTPGVPTRRGVSGRMTPTPKAQQTQTSKSVPSYR